MKYTALLLLMASSACHAFVRTVHRHYSKTALSSAEDNKGNSKKLSQVFPEFAKPDPVGPLGQVGDESPKGLHAVFPTFAKPEPVASLGQVGDTPDGKHKLSPVFPPFGEQQAHPPLGDVGESASSKKSLDTVFPDWEKP